MAEPLGENIKKPGFFSGIFSILRKIHSFIGPKLLFVLAIGGVVGGAFVFLNILADLNPYGKIASLRASAGFPTFNIQSRYAARIIPPSDCQTTERPEREGAWAGCYYEYSPNSILSLRGEPDYFGKLVFSRSDANIKFDWTGENGASSSPGGGIGNDYFAARWSRTVTSRGGLYKFKLRTDDGMRVYIDGQLVFDKWMVQSPKTYEFTKTLAAGDHKVIVEYFEATGWAVAEVSIEGEGLTAGPVPPLQPPVNASCDSPGILPVSMSGSNPTSEATVKNAADNNLTTIWNSGAGAPQSVRLDLGAVYTITKICLNPEITPGGVVKNIISAGRTVDSLAQVSVLEKSFESGRWEEVTGQFTGRYVRILTDSSPSWVAWRDIRVYGTVLDDVINPPNPIVPPPSGGGCPVNPPALEIIGTVPVQPGETLGFSVPTSSPGDWSTLTNVRSSDNSIFSVDGTVGTASRTKKGTVTVNGQASYRYANGGFCSLAPVTVQVGSPDPEQPTAALYVGTVYASCTPTENGYATFVTARGDGTAYAHVTGNGRGFLGIGPNEERTEQDVYLGYVARDQDIEFFLVADGTNGRVLVGPVNVRAQLNPNCPEIPPSATFSVSPVSISLCPSSPRSRFSYNVEITVSDATTTGIVEGANQRFEVRDGGLTAEVELFSPSVNGQIDSYQFNLYLLGVTKPQTEIVTVTADSSLPGCSPPTS